MIGKTISHYKIIEKLGEGGMGVVYKAEDTKLKRTVALKFLPPELTRDSEAKERFVREAQAASALDHPYVATIHEINETDNGQLFIAMACYEGETLKHKIEKGPLRIDEAMELAMQVAEGLAKAHQKGIIHRDIKPANVMVTSEGRVKILDFGLAKLQGQSQFTKTGTTLGTVAYMSPEQLRGEIVDHRTDIWSLGILIYEMVAGRLPSKGDYEQAVTYSILNEEPEPMTSLRTGVPMELEQIVNKTLAKNSSERYQHVEDILVDLRTLRKEWESGKTRAARLTKKRLLERNRTYLYGGLAILLILLIVGGISLFTGGSEAIDSIAVLPLENLSGDPEQDYFADGMTEALITNLSKVGALKVISRTSAMQYKGTDKALPEIARELNVHAVVEGTVLRVGERVRITANLIEAMTDHHLWGESYERDLRDVLALQSEVAQAITDEIKIAVTPEEEARLASVRPINTEAHEAYLKGRYTQWHKMTEEGFKKAIEYFEQAITKDSGFAPAYAGLSDSYIGLGWFGYLSPKEAFARAKAAATKALQIDDKLAEAYTSLGYVNTFYNWDWLAAEQELKRAIELNPSYATAHLYYSWNLLSQSRLDESIAEVNRAQELDPLSPIINGNVGWIYYFRSQYDQAIEEYRKTLELNSNFSLAHFMLGAAYEQKAMYEEAITEFRKAITFSGGSMDYTAWLGHAYALAGKEGKALKILNELKELQKRKYVSSYDIARIHIGLGDKDQAFAWLEKAYEQRVGWMAYLKVDPNVDSLRSDPRFSQLLKRIGLEK